MITNPEEVGLETSKLAAWLGTAIGIFVTGALTMRKWLSRDAASRAEDGANIAFLQTLMEQLKEANERADRFARERNEAIEQIGDLKAQVAALQLTVEHMQSQIERMICPQ